VVGRIAAMVLRLLLAALLLIVGIARGATVTGTFKNSDGTAYTSAVTFRPVSSPSMLGADTITGADVKVTPGSGGFVSTSLTSGYYSVYLGSTRRFTIAVPSGSSTVDVTSILTTPAWFVPGEAGASGLITNTYGLATTNVSGGVLIDSVATNPVVYLKTSVDALVASLSPRINGLQLVSSESALTAIDPTNGSAARVFNGSASSDWTWNSTEGGPDISGERIRPTNYVTGSWIKGTSWATSKASASNRGLRADANGQLVASDATSQQVDKGAMHVATIAALKALSTNLNSGQVVIVGGYNSNGDGGGGPFWYDGSDTTSTDDGGSVIVSTAGGMRFKRIILGAVTPLMWGALGNGTGDDSSAFTSAILYAKRGSTNASLGLRIVDGLGLQYRLTSPVGSLATDGFGNGVSIVNATFVQGTTNTPILKWDISSTTNTQAGDSGWAFDTLSFNWESNPLPSHSNSVAFYLAAPKITNSARDYSLIYNSSFRNVTFNNAHTGFRSYGKALIWGSSFENLRWYGNCVGPLIDWSEPRTCEGSSPGNQFRLIYARVDGFADSSSSGKFIQMNTQRDCLIDGVELNLARTNVVSYLQIDGAQNVDIRNIRLEGNSTTAGGWAPNFDGFVSLPGAVSGIRVSGISFQNVLTSGNGYLVRFPSGSSAVDTSVESLSLDTVTSSGSLWGIGSTSGGASGTTTPITQISCSGTIGLIYPYDATSLIWSVRRASRQWTSADRGDASITITPGLDAGIQMFRTNLTANRTVTLGGSFTAGTVGNGDEFLIVRTNTSPFALAVGSVVTFAAGQSGAVLVRWIADGSSGGNWTLVGDYRARSVSGTVTITAQSVGAGAQYTTTATVPGASFDGDRYTWALPNGAGSSAMLISVETASTDTAVIRFYNPTGVSITLPAQTITITKLFP
jgi:hypothetical protein